nr:hypothetical protein [Pseudomonadota bacterium]
VFVRNNLQAGGKAMRIALIGDKGGQAPPGYEAVPVKGNGGVALLRILVDDRTHFAAIDAARKASNCRAVTPS